MSNRRFDVTVLSRVRARLGEGVTDPARWIGIMEDVCAAVGAHGAILLQGDIRTPDVPCTPSVQEVFSRNYFKPGWHRRDLRARGIPLFFQGRKVFTDEDITTPEERRREPYYNECVFASGVKAFAAVGFFAGSKLWALTIHRASNQEPFEENDLQALGGLADNLTAAATLSAIVGHSALTAATDALGLVHQPALAIDRLGNVIRTNQAAENLFDDDIRVRDCRLHVHDKAAAAALGALMDRITASAGLPAAEPVTIRRRLNTPVVARLHPIPDAARSPFLGARALLVFSSLAPRPPLSACLLAQLFGLSPAEARLASIMAGGVDLHAAAEELGVARNTARNQLKAIFVKTGAHRQSQLVDLLAKLPT